MSNLASRITNGDLSAAVTVADGLPLWVFGIVITNQEASAQVVRIKNTAGTVLFSLTAPANSCFELQRGFIADAGIKADMASPSANVSITFFHSHPGR